MVLRVGLDNDFITKAFQKATTFFTVGILPELVGKWYTKAPVYSHVPAKTDVEVSDSPVAIAHSSETDATTEKSDEDWCYCRGKDEGEMIACDNDAFKIRWFHTQCLKLCTIPKRKWFCPSCQKTVRKGRKRQQ